MTEIEFCPFCSSAAHKIIALKEELHYCKECSRFFDFRQEFPKCPKCKKGHVKHSDFPAPDGSLIFQCNSCKKMFNASELLAS